MAEGKMVLKEEEDEENGIYVGRTVKKFFLGFGYFHGKVISFNRYRKFYKVKYDDGDREELDLKELKEVLVDHDCREPQPLLLPSTNKLVSTGRRGRKRRRDSADEVVNSIAAPGECQHDNLSAKNSPSRLEEVKVLNAQTKEIYRQLRGSNGRGEDGELQGEELLLEPLVPVSLENDFEKSTKQSKSKFEAGQGGGKRRTEACGSANRLAGFEKTSSCRRKRAKVSPVSNPCLQQQQIPAIKEEVRARIEESIDTERLLGETAMTTADVPLPSVGTGADSPLWHGDNGLNAGKHNAGGKGHEQEKIQFSAFLKSLPPSSRTLGKLDDCVGEFFQVYSLIRSFSNLIFLSPFSLEEFAYSLVSTDVCVLTDCVHLSLLQTLRRQLERLSKNGSKSATFSLRLSDWSLLDTITWPSFLVGYMLTQGFNFSSDGQSFVKSSLSISVEYYKLPVRTKLAILSFLSDKVLDTDEARAELGRRTLLENDPETMETKGFACKSEIASEDETLVHGVAPEALSPSAANAIRVGRLLDEDGNLDECVLCAMDGNLICCDGCPAAYHSRCVGVTKQGLPTGDWFCPECSCNKHDPRGARISKGLRGGELLAIGPESQYFYNTCGYLLISESGPMGQVENRYYNPRDVHTVVHLLEKAGPSYSESWNALQQFYQVATSTRMTRSASSKATSALEVFPSVVSSSEKEADRIEGQCSDVSEDVENSYLAHDSLTAEQTKNLVDLPMSHMHSADANCEPTVASSKSTSALEVFPSVVSSSAKEADRIEGQCSHVSEDVQNSFLARESLTSEQTKNPVDLPMSHIPSADANCEPTVASSKATFALEVFPTVVSSSAKEADRIEGQCSHVSEDVQNSFLARESLTSEQTKNPVDLPMFHIPSADANCEPTVASSKATFALEVFPTVVSSSAKEADRIDGQCSDVSEDVQNSFLARESLTSEQTKNPVDLPMFHMSSADVNCEPITSPIISSSKGEHDVKQILSGSNSSNHTTGLQPTSDVARPCIGEEEKKAVVRGEEPRRPGDDDLQSGVEDKSLSSELENIWRQHACYSPMQMTSQSINSPNNEEKNVESKFVIASNSLSTGLILVDTDRNGTCAGDVEFGKMICLQQELSNDVLVGTSLASPEKPASDEEVLEQRDELGGLRKRDNGGHLEGRISEREVNYRSTITQINACSYKNKYANCDLVATAAFNLAAMAGGVDDLVDDGSGSMRKPKQSSAADHVKAFTQASSPFFWPSVKKRGTDVPKEKCGWCYNCRSTIRRGCLLTQVAAQMAGGAALVVGGIRSLKGGTGHFPAVAAYILYMEEQLHCLLEGPWEYPGHRKKWRKQVEQAKLLKDIILALLEMESSMRKVVLSPDWDKVEEDYPESIASSALIISTANVPGVKKVAPTRKRGRPTVVAKPPPAYSYDGACFGVRWWRGGSLSRKAYNWESLTRASLRRAGRQGGIKEIPELVYSKSLDLPRRTRRFAWQTRLEKVSSIAQVAVEVRYLDTFIKWNDIISPLEATTTHSVKGPVESDTAFHKAKVRTKKDASGVVKYLLGFPTDTDGKIDAPTHLQPEVPPEDGGVSAGKPDNKEQQASVTASENDVWVTESQVPPFLLKAYVEKLRADNQSDLLKTLKKGKLKGSKQDKRLTFWNLLCNPRLAAPQESKKVSGWVCGLCNLACSKSQHVRCQRCTGDFHKKCTQLEDSINGEKEVPVCNGCVQSRLGHRMRQPSYKMLAVQSQLLLNGSPASYSEDATVAEGSFPGSLKLICERDRPDLTLPPDSKSFGREKKRLITLPRPSQLDCEYIWMEKKGKRKTVKKKGYTTVFPCQYEGEPAPVEGKQKRKRSLGEETDRPQPKKRGRKRQQITQETPPQERRRSGRIRSVSPSPTQAEQKEGASSHERRKSGRISVSSSPSQGERNQDTSPQEKRTSGRIRNSISPNAATFLSLTEQLPVPRRYKNNHKLDEECPEKSKSIPIKRKRGRPRKYFTAPQNRDEDENENDGGDEVVIKLPVKRKRLKIIFDGLEVGKQEDIHGGLDEGRLRKSGNGLDFGNRLSKSEARIQTFRQERVVYEGQMGLNGGKFPRCGLCSVTFSAGYIYVSCEYCEGWYHGAAVGLTQEDAPHLVGFKCHRCRKCRAPSCPFRQNVGTVKPRRGGAIDHGEVIDAENVIRTGQGQLDSVSLQSAWFSSPDKEFSAFSDAKAFPDFVAATNQAEEALAADGSNFGHDVLSNDFDMRDLVLAGDSQEQLNPLSLEDQEVNMWTTNESAQLHLRSFCVSQADVSSEVAPRLSFTELLASEDDIFEGVSDHGLGLSTGDWSGGIYGSGSLAPLKPPLADITPNAGIDSCSPFVSGKGTISSGSGNLVNPLKIPGTEGARINDYTSVGSVNVTASRTALPVKQCGSYSYIDQSTPLTVTNGDNEQRMVRVTSSVAMKMYS